MSVGLNTNVSSLRGLRNINKATNNLDTTMNRLSSGKRINSAKDDAAGLQISERLLTQLNGLFQGNSNANNGLALAQTVEGVLSGTSDSLQRMRQLAVQAANGTLSADDRQALQSEMDQLSAGVTQMAERTTFNGENLLDANNSSGNITLQVGANANDTMSMQLQDGFTMQQMVDVAQNGDSNGNTYGDQAAAQQAVVRNMTSPEGNYQSLSIATQADAENAISAIDSMINYVGSSRATVGAMENRLESTISNQSNVYVNTADARSRINDADYAEEASNMISQQILLKATVAMQTQANGHSKIAMSLLGS